MNRNWLAKAPAVLAAAVLILGTGVAHAQLLAGRRMLQVFGGANDGSGENGHMALAGSMMLTPKGGAKAVNVTVVYQDSKNDADGFVCTFTDPSDVAYSFPNGLNSVGTLTLTLAADDPPCFEMTNPKATGKETGGSVTFVVYRQPGAFALLGDKSTLIDADSDTVSSLALSGTLTPAASIPKNRLGGIALFNALGGTTDTSSLHSDSGHLALAGRAALTPKGAAKSLDLTLSYIDSDNDNFVCELTDPTDLSYSISKGVGSLTLKVGANDSATCPNSVGESITFTLYSAGAQTRLIATSSSLADSFGDVIGSVAMAGSM